MRIATSTRENQYVNLRRVRLLPGVPSPIAALPPERCDLLVVRENTEGLYAGAGGVLYPGTAREVATQESLNTRSGVERAVRDAFARATRRRSRLTLSHERNVLPFAGDLWQRTVDEVAAASALERAVEGVLPQLGAMGGPEMGYSTEAIGDRIAEAAASSADTSNEKERR